VWGDCSNHSVVVPGQRMGAFAWPGQDMVIQTNQGVFHPGASGCLQRTFPGWRNGTTTLWLFIYSPFTQGSACEAQPWALWQKPVGLPGGGLSRAGYGFPIHRWASRRGLSRADRRCHIHPWASPRGASGNSVGIGGGPLFCQGLGLGGVGRGADIVTNLSTSRARSVR
jgi:hypothetical protein